MTVRLSVRCLQMAIAIVAWMSAGSVALGIFAAGCGAALGAAHGNFGLAASIGERGFLAGLIAGAIVGICAAVDRVATESYLAKMAVLLPPTTDWPTTAAVKPRYPEWRMTKAKSVTRS